MPARPGDWPSEEGEEVVELCYLHSLTDSEPPGGRITNTKKKFRRQTELGRTLHLQTQLQRSETHVICILDYNTLTTFILFQQ